MSFQNAQDQEYLDLCIERAKSKACLDWVLQVSSIIDNMTGNGFSVNDIGCNVGHFYKVIRARVRASKFSTTPERRRLLYKGYDVEQVYIDEAIKLFPELGVYGGDPYANIEKADIQKEVPSEADVTVCSATLEHLQEPKIALENMLKSTKVMILLRTFLGESSFFNFRRKEGAEDSYIIRQFSFERILGALEDRGFKTEVIRDAHTQSLPRYIGKSESNIQGVKVERPIIRTFYIVKGIKV